MNKIKREWRNKSLIKKCIFCSNVYHPPIGKDKQFKSKYCSLNCLNLSKFKGRFKSCSECGKMIWVLPSKDKLWKYCSLECYNQVRSKMIKGEGNPNCKVSDKDLLRVWGEWKKSNDLYPARYFLKLGYSNIPILRLISLVGEKDFKENYYSRIKNKSEMSRLNYYRGRDAEYKCIKEFEKKGYTCARTAGSKGVFDVYCTKENDTVGIQLKRTINLKAKITSFKKDLNQVLEFKNHPTYFRKAFWIWKENSGWEMYEITDRGILDFSFK